MPVDRGRYQRLTSEELASLSERAARVISSGAGLKALAQLLADALQGAVLVEDDQWRHLAFAQADRRSSKGDRYKPPASFAQYYKEGKDAVVRATIGQALHGLCAPMLAGPADDDEPAGYVSVFLHSKPPPHAGAALRIIAGAAGVDLLRRGAGRAQSKRAFWEHYLNGGFADAVALRDEAASAGVALAHAYVAAAFDVEGLPASDAREALASAIVSADGSCPLALPGGVVVALFPVRNQADVARARQAAANAVHDLQASGIARSVTCGIGAHHADALETAASLAEARQALAIGRRLSGRGSVTVHAELGLLALLDAGAGRDAFARFADAFIEPLAAYDRKHKTELLKTLRLYFEVGENVKEAAERLSVHRHTIFYRLNQIVQILKVDLRSPRDQLSLRAAFAIRQMRSEADQ